MGVKETSEFIRAEYPGTGMGRKRRRVFSVGINDADYVTAPTVNGASLLCPAYRDWRDMVKRVYSEKYLTIRPTYRGAKLHEDWHYFSAFREWWIHNVVDGYQLDKDILVENNRTYSPETCVYIPAWLNTFIIDHRGYRGPWKIGVDLHKRSRMFRAQCRHPLTRAREYLGLYGSEEEAHAAWLTRKLEIAKSLRPEIDKIDVRLYPRIVSIIKKAK